MKARLTLPRLRPLARLSSTAGPLKDGKARKQVIADLVEAVSVAARREVPWFEAQMPPAYFRQVTPERRGAHLRALTALTATRELGRDNLPEVQLRDEGASVREAALEGAVARLRPVLMTVISTLLGALPLVWSSGAGAEARSAIGLVIIGGFGIASLLTLFLTPVLYDLLVRFTRPRSAVAKDLDAALARDGTRTPAE